MAKVDETTEPNQKSKRRLRQTTDTTIRQRTEAAQAKEDRDAKASIGHSFWYGFFWPLRMVGRGLASLGRFRIVRFIGRILLPRYFRNSWRELRQVTWPTRRQTRQLTGAVIMFAAIFGVVVALVDYGLDKLLKELILR